MISDFEKKYITKDNCVLFLVFYCQFIVINSNQNKSEGKMSTTIIRAGTKTTIILINGENTAGGVFTKDPQGTLMSNTILSCVQLSKCQRLSFYISNVSFNKP